MFIVCSPDFIEVTSIPNMDFYKRLEVLQLQLCLMEEETEDDMLQLQMWTMMAETEAKVPHAPRLCGFVLG